jgi:hypothetical protein
MQRYTRGKYGMEPNPKGGYVWAADAEAAIAEAEQRGREAERIDHLNYDIPKAVAEADENGYERGYSHGHNEAARAAEQRAYSRAVADGVPYVWDQEEVDDLRRQGYAQGQRDALAKAIAAVEALDVCWYADNACQSPYHGILGDAIAALRALGGAE